MYAAISPPCLQSLNIHLSSQVGQKERYKHHWSINVLFIPFESWCEEERSWKKDNRNVKDMQIELYLHTQVVCVETTALYFYLSSRKIVQRCTKVCCFESEFCHIRPAKIFRALPAP